MSKTESFYYDVDDFRRDVTGLQEHELDDLAFYFPSYGKRWRPLIIKGLKEGKSHWQIVEDKLKAMDAKSKKQESRDGLRGNVSYKLRRAAFRIVYLRYRIQGHTRRKSSKLARQNYFPDISAEHYRVNTLGCSLDKDK